MTKHTALYVLTTPPSASLSTAELYHREYSGNWSEFKTQWRSNHWQLLCVI